MREDFNKLLVERERIGSSRSFHDVRAKKISGLNDDYFGGKESMKKRHNIGWGTKQFNENLNPLKGFLRSKIGKKWDKVYSELRKTFDARSVINQHILQHLYQYVVVNTKLDENGRVVGISNNYSRDGFRPISESFSEYYVCPRDGTLKVTKKRPRRSIVKEVEARKLREADAVFRVVDDRTHLRLIDGVWYVLEVRDLPEVVSEYVQPFGKTEFTISHRWSKRAIVKKWSELNQQERERLGTLRINSGVVTDALIGDSVSRKSGRGYGWPGQYAGFKHGIAEFGRTKYYASKATAPHKLLKQFQLDGSALTDA